MKKTFQLLMVLLLAFAFSVSFAQEIHNSTGRIPHAKPMDTHRVINFLPIDATEAFGFASQASQTISFPLPAGTPFTNLAGWTDPGFASSMVKTPTGEYYVTVIGPPDQLYQFDPTTGSMTLVGNITGLDADGPNGISYNPADGNYYIITSNNFYVFDLSTLTATLIGPLSASNMMIDLCFDADGVCYAYDVGGDNAYTINVSTGAATVLGPLGFDANYGQGMSYDYETSTIYLSAFNNTTTTGQLRTMNPATGMTTLIVDWGMEQVAPFHTNTMYGPPCPVQTPVNPNPASGAVDVPITGVTLSWSNGGNGTVPPTSVEVMFGPAGNMTSVYSGAPITQWAVPGTLNYFTNYQWKVINKIDTCENSATWSFRTVQDPNYIEYCEPFNDLSDWTIVGPMGMTNWSANNSSLIGGTPPELRMYYNPSFTGKSLIRSAPLNLLNNTASSFSFKFYLSYYTNPSGTITVSITYDGGVTEQILYQLVDPTSSISATTITGNFTTPATGSDNAQIQIWYEGYSYNINWIHWDDLCIGQIAPGPGKATNPNPEDGAKNVTSTNLVLSWTNPSGATSNEVWFGTQGNLQLIHSGSLVSSVNAPTPLNYSTEYYWRVNEINANGTTPGVTWKFKTQMDPNIVTLFWDEFENGLGLWDITNNGGTCVWLIYFPPYPNLYTLPATSSGGVLAADVDECGSGSSLLSSATIISTLDASYYESVSLEFDNDFMMLNATDEGYVEVSTDGGTTWTVVWQVLGVDKRNTHEVVNLSSYVANKAFKLRFRSVQPGWHWFWVVDNVYVYAWDFVPVELTSFTAKGSVNEVELSWITATETNNQGFEIQRDDGKGFVPITFVKGFGTTTEAHAYSYIDKGLKVGTYSYRLKQVDLNGTFSYSDVIEAEVIAPAVFALEQNYPNPFNPTTNINYQLKVDSKVTLKIFDILGQEITTLVNENLEAGKHTAVFNASQLSSGVYMYKLEARGVDGSSFISVKKMLLTK